MHGTCHVSLVSTQRGDGHIMSSSASSSLRRRRSFVVVSFVRRQYLTDLRGGQKHAPRLYRIWSSYVDASGLMPDYGYSSSITGSPAWLPIVLLFGVPTLTLAIGPGNRPLAARPGLTVWTRQHLDYACTRWLRYVHSASGSISIWRTM